MTKTYFLLLICLVPLVFHKATSREFYPDQWWAPVPVEDAYPWEILPQDAGDGEVILSKRTELGVFSNLGDSPFYLDGQFYRSVEGLWQMMKYPEDRNDPRSKLPGWIYSREEVSRMHGMMAKKAGKYANRILRKHGINWITYRGQQFNYKDLAEGSDIHLDIIKRAIWNKVTQNKIVKSLLLQTLGLRLRPDHHVKTTSPPSYFYHEILMAIRKNITL